MFTNTASTACRLEQAANLNVWNSAEKAIPFRDVLEQQKSCIKRTLVVFIRHFFCGNCQEYVRRLASDLAPSGLPEDLSIIIIGCGAPSLIASYIEVTSCPFSIYADPTTQLYKLLGMQRSLSLGSKGPAYIQHSLASGVVKSIVQGMKRIPTGDVAKAGDLSINGGEFLFVRDHTSNWTTIWSHCMMNSRDHTEIDVLKTKLHVLNEQSQVVFLKKEFAGNKLDIHTQGPIKRSLSLRRRTWMKRADVMARSSASRTSMIQLT